MKLPILFLVATVLARTLCAQSNPPITAYFDKEWRTLRDSTGAAYYRTEEKKEGKTLVRNYFISGQLQMLAHCSSVNPLTYDGSCVKYFPNGVVEFEGNYKDNMSVGIHKENYESGKPHTEVAYRGNTKIYIHCYTEAGDDLLNYGRGLIKYEGEKLDTYHEVRDSVLLSHYEVEKATNDTSYIAVEKPAEYKGGLKALGRDINNRLQYPRSARKTQIEGTVLVSFWVDKHGKVTQAYIFRGLDHDCDIEALNTVRSLKDWIPGASNGHPAKTRFIQPIKFKLR